MNYGKKSDTMPLPVPMMSPIEKFTGKRTPASKRPQTTFEDAMTRKRMVKKSKKAAAARSKIQTGNYASD
jgi:hypothetical protein